VELVEAPAAFFGAAAYEASRHPNAGQWFQQVRLRDGSVYLRWSGLFEFLVSVDATHLTVCRNDNISDEALFTYLLGHVLSFALMERGLDPLHATAVMVNGGVVGFLGNSGYGKSTLAGAFLQAGYPIVTDDLLVISGNETGLSVHPGIPRIKLFPEIASIVLRSQAAGTPMNPLTRKLVIPLDRSHAHQEVARLKALYVLAHPSVSKHSTRVVVRRLSQRLGMLALLKNTFNRFVVEPPRLHRQFDLNGQIVSTVPIKMLSYARNLTSMAAAR